MVVGLRRWELGGRPRSRRADRPVGPGRGVGESVSGRIRVGLGSSVRSPLGFRVGLGFRVRLRFRVGFRSDVRTALRGRSRVASRSRFGVRYRARFRAGIHGAAQPRGETGE
jgi:hypothetical protein